MLTFLPLRELRIFSRTSSEKETPLEDSMTKKTISLEEDLETLEASKDLVKWETQECRGHQRKMLKINNKEEIRLEDLAWEA
jgi:hypothetical protein